MSFLDVRTALPDAQPDELRALITHFEDFERRLEARLDAAERLAAERHSWSIEAITRLAEINDLRERIARLEARER